MDPHRRPAGIAVQEAAMHMFAAADVTTALDWVPPLLMVVGIILLGLIFTHSIRSKVARRNAAQPTPRQRIEQLKSAAHRQEDLQVTVADSLKTIQDLAARLNNRAERLEQLISQADERISQLEAGVERTVAKTAETSPDEGGFPIADSPPPPTRPALPADPLTRAVYDLADAGRNPVEIAQELDEQIGKVELILALRQG